MKQSIKLLSAFAIAMLMSAAVWAGETQVNLNVKGMKCGGCEAKVTSVLKNIEGVVSTQEVSSVKGSVTVTIDDKAITQEALASALADKTGYDVSVVSKGEAIKVKGNEKAACCTKGQTKAACGAGK
jgi:copper chaperone